ncbi:MAG TPA: DUF1223 domain-containing protein [Gammaproteobacteria bacterium]|nr:DUF1223 domain-containing protein [Gammaproteobacteria bacterium]
MRIAGGLGLLAGLSLASVALGAPQTLASPFTRVNLIELYTSEGCNDCPPAEAWLSRFTDDKRLWKELVPVAFHVDYWDTPNWRDPFDNSAYTARQHAISARAGNPTVYTPEFVVNGEEWQGFFNQTPFYMPEEPKVGVLSLRTDGPRLSLHFAPSVPASSRLEAHAVLLAFGVDMHVGGGENKSATLRHDFLVIGYGHTGMGAKGGGYDAQMILAPIKVKAARYALAAWVSRADDPAPIQAVGGWTAAP